MENAVRHGVRAKPDGRGTVAIATVETQNDDLVIVTDDGAGFDPDTVPDDGQPHVGIRNVRDRLKSVCGGSLVIESAPSQGTKAIICIPKSREG